MKTLVWHKRITYMEKILLGFLLSVLLYFGVSKSLSNNISSDHKTIQEEIIVEEIRLGSLDPDIWRHAWLFVF